MYHFITRQCKLMKMDTVGSMLCMYCRLVNSKLSNIYSMHWQLNYQISPIRTQEFRV